MVIVTSPDGSANKGSRGRRLTESCAGNGGALLFAVNLRQLVEGLGDGRVYTETLKDWASMVMGVGGGRGAAMSVGSKCGGGTLGRFVAK